jgi:DNA polymerase-1
VHDELVFETKKEFLDKLKIYVKMEMEQAAELSVPLVVDVKSGHSWEELK